MRDRYDEFAAGLQNLREAHRWSRPELAERVGVSEVTVWRWENDIRGNFPTAKHLRTLANVYGLSVDNFMRRAQSVHRGGKIEKRKRDARRGNGRPEVFTIGTHKVELLEDGSLRIRGIVIPASD